MKLDIRFKYIQHPDGNFHDKNMGEAILPPSVYLRSSATSRCKQLHASSKNDCPDHRHFSMEHRADSTAPGATEPITYEFWVAGGAHCATAEQRVAGGAHCATAEQRVAGAHCATAEQRPFR